ncbi:MAG: MarR family transcriptional regulator [Spirochaetes bacterium]|nr:MAG: MarR family transcriptional regulator [Spirochaetota bacterium]
MSRDIRDADFKIVAALDKLSQVQRILLWDAAKNENLSPIQIQFIQFIQQYPAALRRVTVLAREFDLTKATVSDAVSALEAKGLVAKSRDDEDHRTVTLSLTSAGKRIAARLTGWQDALYRHIAELDAPRKEELSRMLMGLIKALFEDGVIRVARMCLACGNFRIDAYAASAKPHLCGLTGNAISDEEFSYGCAHYSVPDRAGEA